MPWQRTQGQDRLTANLDRVRAWPVWFEQYYHPAQHMVAMWDHPHGVTGSSDFPEKLNSFIFT
jgi:hypothetical protein